MADPVVTKSVLDNSLKSVAKVIVDDISGVISDFSIRLDERFNKVEAGIVELKTGAAYMTTEVGGLSQKYDHLINTLDSFLKRLDDQEVDNIARDAHIARIDRWSHQLADKIGLELK